MYIPVHNKHYQVRNSLGWFSLVPRLSHYEHFFHRMIFYLCQNKGHCDNNACGGEPGEEAKGGSLCTQMHCGVGRYRKSTAVT